MEDTANQNLNHNSNVMQQQLLQQQKNSQEKALYITFFCLTTAFLVCHTPRIILNIYEVPMSIQRDLCENKLKRHYYQPSWVIIMSYFEKLFLVLNSSINFIFYCVSGKGFR